MVINRSPWTFAALILALSTSLCTADDAGGAMTERQKRWTSASVEERQGIAERLGEEGAERLAQERGLTPILRPAEKAIAQGPDSVWRTADERGVVVIEAKGGTSPVGASYGYQQGTIENAVKSAERVLTSSSASEAELRSAEAVIDAARRGRLSVMVVRTSHVLGEPKPPVVECLAESSGATSQFAGQAVDELATAAGIARSGAGPTAVRGMEEGAAAESAGAGEALGRGAMAFAVILDLVQRAQRAADVEGAYGRGEITEQRRTTDHVKNAAEFAGGWGGAAAGAETGAEIGSAVGPEGTGIGAILGGGIGYVAGEGAVDAIIDYLSGAPDSCTGGEDEDAAKRLLQLARNFRLNRCGDSAEGYYRQLLAQFPNTNAAEQARGDLASGGR